MWSWLKLKSNYIEHLNNCYKLVTWEWYSKFTHAWKIISTSKTKLSGNYVLCFLLIYVTAAMLNTLVTQNHLIEFKSWNTGKCVKNNSQTWAVHEHMLSCKTVVSPEDFQFLLRGHEVDIQESVLIKLL